MFRTKLARLGKQCIGIHQYHLWSRTVVPKHSENHFGKICATFFKHSFWTTILPWKKKIQGSITCTPFGLLIFFCVCGRFLVNS
jgi:hypothetical protein